MRLALIVICLTGATGLASISVRADDSSGKSEHSTGRTQTRKRLAKNSRRGGLGQLTRAAAVRRQKARKVSRRQECSQRPKGLQRPPSPQIRINRPFPIRSTTAS